MCGSKLISLFVFFLTSSLGTQIVFAQIDSVWDGSTGTWSDASKWSSAEFPDNGNGGFDYNATIAAGNVTLDLSAAIEGFLFSGGTLSSNGFELTMNDAAQWSGGALMGLGATNVDGGLSLFGGVKSLNNEHVFNNAATSNWTSGNFNTGGGSVFNNLSGATFNTDFAGSFNYNLGGVFSAFNNAGTFNKSGGAGSTRFTTEFHNSGIVNLNSGTLELDRGGIHSGAFNLSAGGTLELSGTHDFNSGSSVVGGGDLVLAGIAINFNDGDFNFGGTTTTIAGNNNFNVDFSTALLNISGGVSNINNASTLTSIGTMTWTGGALNGNGITRPDAGVDLSGGVKSLNNEHVFNNVATSNWTSGNFNTGGGAVFNNLSGATFNTDFAGSFNYNLGGVFSAFSNAGTFNKSGGAGSTRFTTEFHNSGTVNLNSGTLELDRGGIHTGAFNLSAGGTLELSGTHDFNGGSSINGTGVVNIIGTNVTIAGGAISPGNSIGTLSFNGATKIVNESTLEIEVKATSGSAGTDWDFIDVTGTLDFDDAVLPSGATVKLKSLDSNGNPGLLVGFDQGQDYTWQIGSATTFEGFSSNFVIVDTSEFENDFCGIFTVTQSGNQLLLNYLSQVVSVNADGLFTLRGFIFNGTVESTFGSDNEYLQYNPGFTINSSEPPVWLEFEGTLPDSTPQWLNIKLESHANTINIRQQIEMYNWLTEEYELVDTRPTSFNVDSTGNIAVPIPMEFVEAGTNRVKARTGWKADGFVILYPWTVSIDYVAWLLR